MVIKLINKIRGLMTVLIFFVLSLILVSTTFANNDGGKHHGLSPTEVALMGAGGVIFGAASIYGLVSLFTHHNDAAAVFEPYIGMQYGGGTVVYIDQKNRKLLIMANVDQSTENGLAWGLDDKASLAYDGCNSLIYDYTNNCGAPYLTNEVGSGVENTNKILNVFDNGDVKNGRAPAAEACVNYDGGGFHDWYLPSEWEHDQVYRYAVKKGLIGSAGGGNCSGEQCFSNKNNMYYSSTSNAEEEYYAEAYGVYFDNDKSKGAYLSTINIARSVRAVRTMSF